MNSETQNLIAMFTLTILVIFLWQFIHPTQVAEEKVIEKKQPKVAKEQKLVANEERIFLENQDIKIGFNLQGLKVDFAELKNFKETTDENSPNVKLLNSIHAHDSGYFEFGWLKNKNNDSETVLELPNTKTKWLLHEKSESKLVFMHSVKNLIFYLKFMLDDNFMINVEQTVVNIGEQDLDFLAYGRIQKSHDMNLPNYFIAHEGFLGTPSWKFTEKSFKKILKKQNIIFNHQVKKNPQLPWIGIGEKYWMQALILPNNEDCQIFLKSPQQNSQDSWQKFYVDFTREIFLEKGQQESSKYQIFVGPKQASVINNYKTEKKIFMFDHAIDLGIFSLITKPIFIFLQFLNRIVHNFGIAIIILTTVIKLLMYPLANKAHHSTKMMQKLQPKITQIKEKFKNSPLELQKETIKLFRKNKVNPFASLLPLLIQIPVFFSLYKVLFITIEMRQAPFFGWIHDLSAPDPLYVTNLFGLLPYTPPAILAIGIFPVLLCITSFLQQKILPNPMINKPEHAILNKAMPFIFLFIFSSFPVGLVIYWVWNNILMILQQFILEKTSKN